MDFERMGETARAQIRAGWFDAAEATCREILAAEPRHRAARYVLGALLLSRGAYAEGFPLYEARLELPETGIKRPQPSYPEWDGRPINSLMVWGEQGFGDQMLFARYLPPLAARGVRVTLICSPQAAPLFDGLAPVVLAKSGELSVPRHDAWCMMGSLPRHLPGDIPVPPYLRGRARAGGGGVGVVWEGNALPDPTRSLPAECAAELLGLPGAVSLQPADSGARDFQDTADLIAGLDLVISIDTAVANLAGAMGKPVWVLLPERPDWRWGRSGERTPWYPSARLFRRTTESGWRAVVEAVKARLQSDGKEWRARNDSNVRPSDS